MLLDNVKIIVKQEIKLVGYSIQASLNDDIQVRIVEKLREELVTHSAQIANKIDDGMYLVQIYPECEWTPDVAFTHIVATEVQEFQDIPDGMITHTVPEGRFILFMHEGTESEIDATYDSINEWLERNNFDDLRAFDMEHWINIQMLEEQHNMIHIYVPVK
ncbi:MAG: GyrI-like domain-containing protein [Bacillota bacterium]